MKENLSKKEIYKDFFLDKPKTFRKKLKEDKSFFYFVYDFLRESISK